MSRLSEQIEDIRDIELIKGVQFSILSPENIRKGSVVEVIQPDTYDGTEPKVSGLFDPRMGVIEDGRICATCENKAELCPGHFGHIELALPIYNIQYIETIIKILRCVCFRCSNILVNKSDPVLLDMVNNKSGKNRFNIIYSMAQKAKQCIHNDGCLVLQPKKYVKNRPEKMMNYEKNLIYQIGVEFPPEAIKDEKIMSSKQIITPNVCLNILKKISAEDCEFLGFSNKFSRPEWMILTTLAVPPPAMRPSVRQDNNQRSEDDLTYSLVSIVKYNRLLKQKIESDCAKGLIDSYHGMVQYYVATFIDNEIPGIPACAHRSGRCLKAITQRQKGKEGRIRGNLMGKRVDFSARSVISVDPNLSIDEFGVPKEIAMNMTFPEVVTKYNMNDMYKLVRNGPTNYPGAKSVKKTKYDCNGNPSPCVLSLKYVDVNNVVLHEGDIVNRHMQDGDYCIFNRQPSLHRMSMMGMRARILPGKTFKLNVSVCLAGDTRINTQYGSCQLKDLNKDIHTIKSVQWNTEKNIYDCGISEFYEIDPKKLGFECYRIKTETGQILECTEDHPFMIKGNDRIKASDLKEGDYLVSYNEILPEIDLESGMDILMEDNINTEGIKVYKKHLIKTLKNNGLINIKKGDIKQQILAGLLGHLIGDGTLWWNDKCVHLTFRCKDECDIYDIKKDLLRLGIDEKIIKVHRHKKLATNSITNRNGQVLTIEGKEDSGLYEIDIRSKPIAVVFWNIGMPVMDRIKQEFNIPEWIMKGSKMVKKQFLAGYFGTDMSKPAIAPNSNYRFRAPEFKMSKIDGLTPYGLFDNIYQLLSEFDINANPYGTGLGNIRKDGHKTTSYNGTISSKKENLINFFEKIGYLYCKEKIMLANCAAQYLKYSLNEDNKRVSYYKWLENHTINGSVLCWNRINSIEKIDIEKVYDITTSDFNHNFNGNGIFSLNCSPYNADFDGDEMNAHSCNSVVTHEELKNIASVPTQIISPSKCSPIITLVQDTLVASYLMTQDNEKIYKPQIENLMMNINTFDGKLPPSDGTDENGNEYWLGRTVYSMILPDISLRLKNNSDKTVMIKNGKYLEGNLDSNIIGKRGLIQDTLKTYGTNRCHQFLDETQNIFTRWMETHGFSVGIGDGVPLNQEMRDKIQEIIESKIEESKEVITSAYQGLYVPELDNDLRLKSMDLEMKKIGSDTVNDVLKYIKGMLTPDNRFNIMATSGAKGKPLNLQQIMGIVGQQEIWGSRIHNGFSDRTLPHFHKNDFGLSAKGFVRNSFVRGVNPEEFFFSMMGGRVGMIDTAVRTAETGYISRKLMKSAEDVKIMYDGTVRNSANNVVQFVYGDDNYDPTKLEKVNVDLIKYNNLEMEDKFKFNFASEKDWENVLLKPAMKEMLQVEDYQKYLDEEYQYLFKSRDKLRNDIFRNTDIIDITTFMPFNLFKYIPAIKFKFNIGNNNVSDLSPIYVINRINDLCDFVTKYMKDKNSNELTKIIIKTNLASKVVITHYKLNKIVFDYIMKELEHKLVSAFVQPGEMVGPIAAQSLGESNQQLTLNSVAYNEKILIVKDGKNGNAVEIGDFIDKIIDNTEDKSLIENHPNDTFLRWTKDTDDYKVISVDEDGVISWKKIEAVTRHPVINEDASKTLINVTTRNGRTVTATKAKSFLTRVDNKIVATKGSDLKIGDKLPVMKNFPMNDIEILNELSLEKYFPKDEYIWGSEMKKALDCKQKEKYWFKKNNGVKFITPYNRCDTLMDALKTDFRKRENYEARDRRQIDFNKLYMKNGYSNGLSEKIMLDEIFGFFIGAYLAEGCVTENYVAIANNDEKYRQMIIEFCEKYDQTYHIQVQNNKTKEGWTSIDIRIHSVLIARLMKELCGKGSENKRVPDFAYLANDEFVKGLLNGYFSGDRCVNHKRNTIIATSISEQLIDGILNLLSRYSIFAKKDKPKKIETNNRDSKNIKQHWTLTIANGNTIKFASNIDLVIEQKQERLDKIYNDYKPKYENGKFDIVPGFNTEIVKGEIHKNDLEKLLKNTDESHKDYKILESALYSDVYFDEIIKIEEIEYERKYVYDLTVEETRTFVLLNTLCQFDTFHQAGSSAGSVAVTSGVPRMKEIISLSKTMKTPSMDIYLNEEYANDRSKAEKVKNQMQYTKMGSIVIKTEIIYENIDDIGIDINSNEDLEFVNLYYEFNDIICVDTHEDLSKWVLRIEFDREMMMSKNILMSDVEEAIKMNSQNEDSIQCIINDDNSSNLIMRIRVRSETEDENFLSFFKEFEKYILDITLKGVKGVNSVDIIEGNIIKYGPDGSYNNTKEWFLRTDGSNLTDTMLLNYINTSKTYTNNIIETYEIFGIEGVRSKIIKELQAIFSNEGVNQRHINLLVDIMTNRGTIMQIDRHGINRASDNGVITKASFEEVTDIFIKASTFSELDKMTGVSSNIMFGQLVPSGTNMFELLLDEEKLMNFGLSEEEQQEFEPDELDEDMVQEELNEMYEDMDEDLEIEDDDFEFGYSLENVQEYNLGPIKKEDEEEDVVKVVDNNGKKPIKKIIKKKNVKNE